MPFNLKNLLVISCLSWGLSIKIMAGSYLDWRISFIKVLINGKQVQIRSGFIKAMLKPGQKFKGNILYYQGLGDSMLNHDPLFEPLINDGYRVIAFDYMGQGRSDGNMKNTTIANINSIGDQVLKHFARSQKGNVKYHIIGWSTGGLAAYRRAYLDGGKKIKSVTLIAPGIAPNTFVGKGLWNIPPFEITAETLTNNRFIDTNDPHTDVIYPISPLYVFFNFALDLKATAKKARREWKISPKIRGLVLLSGANDNYVDTEQTLLTIQDKADHFQYMTFCEALHEIDNEIEDIAKKTRKSVLSFINNELKDPNTDLEYCIYK